MSVLVRARGRPVHIPPAWISLGLCLHRTIQEKRKKTNKQAKEISTRV